MRSIFLYLTLSSLYAFPLVARTIMCEQCEPNSEPDCDEHLFVERSQVFITSEFLYWNTCASPLDYGIKMDLPTTAPSTLAIGKYQVAEYEWRPGFRVSLAYYRCPRYWEVTGEYTCFYNRGNDHSFKSDILDHFLSPTWDVATSSPFKEVTSLIDLHYQVADAYVARVFDPNPHLRLRLIGGATTSYIKQKWKKGCSNFGTDFDVLQENWRFIGGGIRLGTGIDWFWGGQFYMTGKATFATLVGSYKNQSIQTFGREQLLIGAAQYRDTRVAMHAQFLLGPSWQIPSDCWSFELFIGYELNGWSGLHETIRTDLSPQPAPKLTRDGSGLFGVHGLTARIRVGF